MSTHATHGTRPDVQGLATLLQAWPVAALVLQGGRVLMANAAAQALLGRGAKGQTLQQLLALPAGTALLPRQPGQALVRPITLARAGHPPCRAELCARRIGLVRGRPLALVTLHAEPLRGAARRQRGPAGSALQRPAPGLDMAHEEERRRIARDLHDDLQQTLAAMQMELHLLGGQLSAVHPQAADSLCRLGTQAQLALASTRRIVNELRPPMLEDLGLVPALEALVTQFAHRSGVTCTLQAAPALHDTATLPPAWATVLYRCAQEALANVARHAGAQHTSVALQRLADGRVTLRVSDDGCGLQQGDRRKPLALGLGCMRQRLQALGGQLRLRGRPGRGTTVLATLGPVQP